MESQKYFSEVQYSQNANNIFDIQEYIANWFYDWVAIPYQISEFSAHTTHTHVISTA